MISELKTPDVQRQTRNTCFHCGDPISDRIVFEEKDFCCHGCVTVYDLLAKNGLDQYYDLNAAPGAKASDKRFEYLENPEIIRKLLDFENDTVARVTFFIPAIHCSSCIWLLENLSRLLPGVTQSRVFFVKKELSVTFRKEEISLQNLVVFLGKVGYAPEINLATKKQQEKKALSKQGLKIAVAGFCFGNSMLLSLPEYLDTQIQMDEGFRNYFGYINLLLALPVVFFSGFDYFRSAWGSLRKGFLNIDVPISLGILALFFRSLYEVFINAQAGYIDSLAGLIFFLLLGKWFQNKSYQALSFERDYKSFFPIAVKRISGSPAFVPLEEVRIGDELEIHNQEIFPVDGILVEGKSEVDYSFVTGESMKEAKLPGELIYAGGRHFGAPVRITVHKEVESSYLTSLWNQDSMKKESTSATTSIIKKIGISFTWIIFGVAFLAGLYWAFYDAGKVMEVVTAVLIVACPCASALSVPFTFGHTMRVLGRGQFYLKNSNVIEQMAQIKQLVFDKTGTLTTTLGKEITFTGRKLDEQDKTRIFTLVSNSLHPLSRQLAEHLGDYSRLSMSGFHEETGMGITGVVDGVDMRVGSASFIGAERKTDESGSLVFVKMGDENTGYFTIRSAYREGILDMISDLRPRMSLHLLSGDKDHEQTKLEPYFDRLNFNQKPADKLRYLGQLPEGTLMIGDGLNDAGALKQATVGIAVADELHQFSPSCDAILKGEVLTKLPDFLMMTRFALRIVYAALALSFLYNIVGLYFAVTGQLTPLMSAILMPLSSVTVVAFITFFIHFKGSRLLGVTA